MDDKEIIIENGIYYCPECNSKRITIHEQCVLQKDVNINTRKILNPRTGKSYMSNQQKAYEYDHAITDGIGCWYYECRKCGWKSELLVE